MTGYLIEVYQDTNPNSPTYGQTREERTLSSDCEVSTDPQWEMVGSWCETLENGAQNGYKITQYEDVNESSPSYGSTREERVYDATECVPDTTNSNWTEIIEPIELDDDEIVEGSYCVQIQYQPSGVYGNSGIYHKVEMDANMYSPTYQQVRENDAEDLEKCPRPDTNPQWKEVTRSCNMIMVNNVATFDGTANVTYIDENVYSTTYDTTKIENEVDATNCPSPTFDPIWTVESEECVKVDGENNGEKKTTYRDTNNASSTYMQISSVTVVDEEYCPCHSREPQWEVLTQYCRTDAYGQNGYITINYVDNNQNSPTYHRTSSETYYDSDECEPNTNQYLEEVYRRCELDENNKNTGRLIIGKQDKNPRSATYGRTYETMSVDEQECPIPTDESPNWVAFTGLCKTSAITVDGHQHSVLTGEYVTVYRDTNPNSPSYNETSSVTENSNLCVPTQVWRIINRYCEKPNGENNGNFTTSYINANPFYVGSVQTSSVTVYDTVSCPLPSTPPTPPTPKEEHWVLRRTSYKFDDYEENNCNVVLDSNVMSNNGTFNIVDSIQGFETLTLTIPMTKNGDKPTFSNPTIRIQGCSDTLRVESIDQTNNTVKSFYIYVPNQKVCDYNNVRIHYLIDYSDDY